jgi:DNA-binding transcriptional LysR family regulator
VALAQCAHERQIVLRADGVDELMRRTWARYGLKPGNLLRTTSLEAVRSLVGSGAGITVLPDFLYRPWTLDAEHVDMRNLREELPTVDIGLVWRRGAGVSAALAEFIEVSKEQPRALRGI